MRKRLSWALLAAVVLVGAVVATRLLTSPDDTDGSVAARGERFFDSNDPVTRGCGLEPEYLLRIWRGHDAERSEDITIVPHEPNYSGSFRVASHSGPWKIEQNVPLVLWGPGFIRARGPLDSTATLADVYPTVGRLVGVDLPERDGRLLKEALATDRPSLPKLIVTVVWDGVGRETLRRHPEAWPTLARLEEEGTSYMDATVGSSPSITPATHSTLGTGAFPRRHRVTAINYRGAEGSVRTAFSGKDPSILDLTTFADEIDQAFDNQARVGMLAWKSWHMGMMSHGAAIEGGDRDHLAIIAGHGDIVSEPDNYTPTTFQPPSLAEIADEVDRRDGSADGKWRGREILEQHDNPAWVEFELGATLRMFDEVGFGQDDIPDLFFTNYKVTDIVGHQLGITGDEQREVLRAQDEALGEMIEYLQEQVGDFVVIVTADHGFPPPASDTGAWPLQQGEMEADVNRHFDVEEGSSLFQQTSAVGPFLNRDVLDETGVTSHEIARFLNAYTIRENWKEDDLPEGYEGRGREPILSAAFPGESLPEVLACAFGEPRPPRDLQG